MSVRQLQKPVKTLKFANALPAASKRQAFLAKESRMAWLLLLFLPSPSLQAQVSQEPLPATAGSLELSFGDPPANTLTLRLHLPGTMAVLISDPVGFKTHLLIQAPKELPEKLRFLNTLQPTARLLLDRPDLTAREVEVVLPEKADLTRLKIQLFGSGGELAAFHADSLHGAKTLSFFLPAQGCPTIELTGSGGCKTSATCCSPKFCADCFNCEIKCGQLCTVP